MPNENPAFESSVIPQEEMRKLSGLEMLRGIMEGRYPPPPIGVLMDFALIAVEHGRPVFSGSPDPLTSTRDTLMHYPVRLTPGH